MTSPPLLPGTPAGSASHHVRNALQILKLYSSPSNGAALDELGRVAESHEMIAIAREDLAAIERRLNAALKELQTPIVLSAPSLKAFIAAAARQLVPGDDTCAYCGCTEASPCELVTAELSDADRKTVAEYFDDAAIPLPAIVPCWWLETNGLPVCSKPSCQAAYVAAHPWVTP